MTAGGTQRAAGRKRLAVARFWFEGNAFAPLPADMAAFERREWRRGAQALAAAEGTATELGAVAAFAQQHREWEVVVLRCASALPAGPIDDAVLDRFLTELSADLEAGIAQGGWDAVYLSLHGAAITRERQTPDLDIVRLVRSVLPGIPLGASFDLHGNLAPAFADLLDVASAYRTHPHVDMAETAARVLHALVHCATGELRTRRVLRNRGVLLPSFNMRTDAGPMRELEELARATSTGPVLEISVFGGFPYSDTVHTGASVFVTSDARLDPDAREAAHAADILSARIEALAPAFQVRLPSPQQAVAAALASARPGLIAVTDPADNPLSGGGADTPALLRALLDARPDVPCVFASFADPGVVARAREAGVGRDIDAVLGGRLDPRFGAGVPVRSTVERLTDGVFRNDGPMEAGVEVRCGGSAVLRVHGQRELSIIVTERVVPADDPAFFRLHGIDPASLRLLCVKAKNHFRAAFASRCSEIIDCDAPGPACLDLAQLPFRNVKQDDIPPNSLRSLPPRGLVSGFGRPGATDVKIACVQMTSSLDVGRNLEKACGFIADAARAGCELVVLPEFFNTIYFAQYRDMKWFELAEPDSGRSIGAVRDAARASGIAVVATIWEHVEAGLYFDTAMHVDRTGAIGFKYRKVHPAGVLSLEKLYFRYGSRFDTYAFGDWRIGIGICYDMGFPETARCLALNGAQLLLAPYATSRVDMFQEVLRTRAFENGCFLAAANKVGQEGEWTLGGGSVIVDPSGRVLAAADTGSETLIVADIERSAVDEARLRYPVRRDRRPDLYGAITAETDAAA